MRAEGSVEDGFECAVLSVAELLDFDHFLVKPFGCPSRTLEICIIRRLSVYSDCAAELREVTFVCVEGIGIEEEGALFACHGGERIRNYRLQMREIGSVLRESSRVGRIHLPLFLFMDVLNNTRFDLEDLFYHSHLPWAWKEDL